MLGILVVWLALSLIAGIMAGNKGRSAIGFFLLSMLLSPLVGLIAAFVAEPDTARREDGKIASGALRRCPYCAEMIRPEAIICRFCGHALATMETTFTDSQWDNLAAALKARKNKDIQQ